MSGETRPMVDVVIPTLNEASHITMTLESLERQDYPKDKRRVFVVDNGSTDATIGIAEGFGVEVLRQRKPGAGAARNLGIISGSGQLVAFVDGHCRLAPGWITAMVAAFSDPQVGGAQGSYENRSVNPRVQTLLDATGILRNDNVLKDSVYGLKNPYPWLVTGNSVYRREAIERAGLFAETLRECEDVDLGWRVALLGYQLCHVPAAAQLHLDTNSWPRFLAKSYDYAFGAAQLAHAYRDHGIGGHLPLWSGSRGTGPPVSVATVGFMQLLYWLGHQAGCRQARRQRGLIPADRPLRQVPADRRRPFAWDSGRTLGLSRWVLHWAAGEDSAIILNLARGERLVLEASARFIWDCLAQGLTRGQTIARLAAHYSLSEAEASEDIDALARELLQEAVLVESAQV